MRLALVTVLVALALPVAIPAAAALVGCVPACEVQSHTTGGFLPRLTALASGATVTWRALDTFHVAQDASACFSASYTPASPAVVAFSLRDGALYASSGGGAPRACASAVHLPDGSALLHYTCPLHPNTMQADLLVK